MIGTILNAAGILIGGILGLFWKQQMSQATQVALKGLLGVLTVYVGLRAVWLGLGGGLWGGAKQLLILVLALTLGRITGRLLRVQKGMNRLGQYAKQKFSAADPNSPQRMGEGFMTCTVLFCVPPLAILGAVLDGLAGQWQALGIKALIDGLATMAFVRLFGWGSMVSALPVLSFQGTVSLGAKLIEPFLREHALLDSVSMTSGMLVFCVALIILEWPPTSGGVTPTAAPGAPFRRIELGDYLPSLGFAPLLTWLWR